MKDTTPSWHLYRTTLLMIHLLHDQLIKQRICEPLLIAPFLKINNSEQYLIQMDL